MSYEDDETIIADAESEEERLSKESAGDEEDELPDQEERDRFNREAITNK